MSPEPPALVQRSQPGAACDSAQHSEEVQLQAVVAKEVGESMGIPGRAAPGQEICWNSGTASSMTKGDRCRPAPAGKEEDTEGEEGIQSSGRRCKADGCACGEGRGRECQCKQVPVQTEHAAEAHGAAPLFYLQ